MKSHCQIYCPMIACLLCVYTPTLTLPMPPHHSPCTCTVSQSLSPRLQTSPQPCASQSPAHHTTHLQPGTGNHSHLGPHLPHHSSKLESCISVKKILQKLLVIPPYLNGLFLALPVINISKFQVRHDSRLTDNAQESSGSILTCEVMQTIPVHQLPVSVTTMSVVPHHTHLTTNIY